MNTQAGRENFSELFFCRILLCRPWRGRISVRRPFGTGFTLDFERTEFLALRRVQKQKGNGSNKLRRVFLFQVHAAVFDK